MIGSGKTLYTKKLAQELGTEPFFEPVDENPILDKYYADPGQYAFALQIYFLNKRFDLIKQAFHNDNNVLDRSIYEDELFTYVNVLEGNISEEEFSIYKGLIANMMEELEGLPKKAPDLLVYLDVPLDKILANIKKRGRDYEQVEGNPELLEYYTLLHGLYGDWFDNYDYSPKLRVSAGEFDIHEENDWEEVYALIRNKMKEEGLE